MQRTMKLIFGLAVVAGLAVLALAVFASRDLDRYAALSPSARAAEDRASQAASEAARAEALKGTDCEKLAALECYDMRRQRKNLERAAEEYEKSDLKKAVDDAGVR